MLSSHHFENNLHLIKDASSYLGDLQGAVRVGYDLEDEQELKV